MIEYQTTEPGASLRRVRRATPVPVDKQILMRVVACGVCHSDIHLNEGYFDLGDDKKLEVAQPGHVLGHEIFGEVVAYGPQAKNVAIGDRKVIYPWIGCGSCASCRRGEEHLCTPGRALGIVTSGGFADHVLVPHSRYLFEKGNKVDDGFAATLACSGLTAYSALKKAQMSGSDEKLVIIGAGGVGSMAIRLALSVFNYEPLVVDVDDSKLEQARQLGVRQVFNANSPDLGREIKKTTGGIATSIDFVGSSSSTDIGLQCLRKGGKLIIVGLYGGMLRVPIPFIPMSQRTIQGSYVGSLDEMGELMDLVRSGEIPPFPVIERQLENVSTALIELKQGKIVGRQVLLPG